MQRQPAAVGLRPLRLARRRHLRPPDDPAAVRRRRQRADLRRRTSSSAFGATYTPTPTSLLEVALRLVDDDGRQEPGGARLGVARSTRTASPACPTDPRVAGGLPTQLITGFSDLGRQATNPQWQYPTVYNPKINYTWLTGRHSLKSRLRVPAHPDRGAGRQPALRPRHVRRAVHAPGRRRRQQPVQPRRLHVRAAQHLRAQQHPRRQPAAEHALRLPAGRLARQRSADAEPRPALRVRDAVGREGQHPLELRSGDAQRWCSRRDGSLEDRSTIKPDRNNFGPRLGFAYTLDRSAPCVRGGYGVSYVHFHRAGGANVLPINGPQVINAVVVQSNPLDRGVPADQQGYPAGLTDPSRFNPLAANITYMPSDYHSSQVQSWFVSVQRELATEHASSTSRTSATAPTICCCSPTSTRRRRTTPPARSRCRRAGRFRSSPTSPTRSTAASRATTRSRASSTGACASGLSLLQLADAVADQGQRRRLAREPERQLPGAAGLLQPRRRLRPVGATTSRTTARPAWCWDLPVGRGRRFLDDASPSSTRSSAAGRSPAINSDLRRARPVTLTYTPPAAFQVSGIQQDFRGANNYRPNVVGDVLMPEGPAHAAELVQSRRRGRSRPIRASRSATPRATACAGRWSGRSTCGAQARSRCRGRSGTIEFRARVRSTCSTARTSARRTATAAPAAFGTITTTYDPRILQLGIKASF